MQYVGLDVHRDFIYATVVDDKGSKLMESKFQSSIPELHSFVGNLNGKPKIVMEACYSWQYIYDYLESIGLDVTLAHPLKTRLIAESRIKTDKIDSYILANLLRVGMVAESYVPPKQTRDERRISRHRSSLVKIRTIVKNSIHAILARNGIRYQYSDFGKNGIEFLKSIPLNDEDRFELNQYLVLLRVLNYKIEEAQEQVEIFANENYYAKLLISIPGISYYSALLIASEIADINRFPSAKHLCSYAGLVPSTYQSGNTLRHGSITKQGSAWLRWILIQAANKAINSNKRLNKFYSTIKAKKGHNVAITAVARKLLCYAYVMLKEGIKFDALRVNRA